MSRQEKINYIKSTRYYGFAYENLEQYTDQELDVLIRLIAEQIQREEASVNQNYLKQFYICLN